jgi:hypothetical protein
MLALDGVMANILRQKNDRKERQLSRLHFQYRVMDFFAIYVKHQPHLTVLQLEEIVQWLLSVEDKQLISKGWKLVGNIRKLSIPSDDAAEEVDTDALVTTLLKSNLAHSHALLIKIWKVVPLSDTVMSMMIQDWRRYKSVLAACVRSIPSICGPFMTGLIPVVSRKTIKLVSPILLPLLERMKSISELKEAFIAPQSNQLGSPMEQLQALMITEFKEDPKDAVLLKFLIQIARLSDKAKLDMQGWGEKLSSIEGLKNQGTLSLLNEIKRLCQLH